MLRRTKYSTIEEEAPKEEEEEAYKSPSCTSYSHCTITVLLSKEVQAISGLRSSLIWIPVEQEPSIVSLSQELVPNLSK